MLFLAQNGYRVVAHDRRGHGRSSQASTGNDMNGYADDLAAVIEALDLTGVTLVGHSTGGGEVARYIGRHGTRRVAKAVLIAAVPPIMVQTAANPEGLPMQVFDDMRRAITLNRSQFYRDLASDVLRRQPAGRRGPAGDARPVLALEHAGRPQERLREHQGVLRDRLHARTSGRSTCRPCSCTARTTRSFPSAIRR